MEQELNFGQALQLLIDGLNLAQRRGVFSFQESALLSKGIQKIEETLKPLKEQEKKVELKSEKVEQI